MLMLMIESEDQSLFLGFISLPPIGFMPLVRWNYNRPNRGQTGQRSTFLIIFHFFLFFLK